MAPALSTERDHSGNNLSANGSAGQHGLFYCGGTAVITGGDGCIGLAIVEGLARSGTDIISLQLDANTRVSEITARHGRSCAIYICDQRDPKAVDAAFPKILADGHEPTIFVSW